MSDAPLRTVARNTTRHRWQLSTASKCKSRIRSLYSSKGYWIKSRLQVQYLHKIGQFSLFLFLLEFPDLWVYILAKNPLPTWLWYKRKGSFRPQKQGRRRENGGHNYKEGSQFLHKTRKKHSSIQDQGRQQYIGNRYKSGPNPIQ